MFQKEWPQDQVGRQILHLRQKKGWTQRELAAKSGIAYQTICNLECGKRNARLYTLQDIANALDCELVIEFKKA